MADGLVEDGLGHERTDGEQGQVGAEVWSLSERIWIRLWLRYGTELDYEEGASVLTTASLLPHSASCDLTSCRRSQGALHLRAESGVLGPQVCSCRPRIF